MSSARGCGRAAPAWIHASCRRRRLQEALTKQYAQMVPSLAALARSMVRDLDPQVGVAGGAGGPDGLLLGAHTCDASDLP